MKRHPPRSSVRPFVLALCAFGGAALAGDEAPDVTKLYQVTTEGSSTRLAEGEKGKLVISIKLEEAAHVSDEAPLKIALSGTNGAVPEKAVLAYGDQVSKKPEGQQYVNPVVFEVPFTVKAPAEKDAKKVSATVDAKMTFFICTADICARQQKQVSVPVQVCRGQSSSC